MQPYTISINELNALKMIYYGCLWNLEHSKGLKYKQAFELKKLVNNILNDFVNSGKNIEDYIIVGGDLVW